jgi:translation initiation factor 2B subunit (eIF-2B alpha/beta/delta family)
MSVNRMKKAARVVSMLKSTTRGLLGKDLAGAINKSAVDQVNAYNSPNLIPGYKKGGRVKRTGIARLHKGEVVLTASAAKTLKKLLNK